MKDMPAPAIHGQRTCLRRRRAADAPECGRSGCLAGDFVESAPLHAEGVPPLHTIIVKNDNNTNHNNSNNNSHEESTKDGNILKFSYNNSARVLLVIHRGRDDVHFRGTRQSGRNPNIL